MMVEFDTRLEDFPPNIQELKIQHVVLYFAFKDPTSIQDEVRLHFKEQGTRGDIGGGATPVDNVISTRRGNAGSWSSMIGKSPIGRWVLALPDTAGIRQMFKDEQIEDILFVITYSGRTPEWPA